MDTDPKQFTDDLELTPKRGELKVEPLVENSENLTPRVEENIDNTSDIEAEDALKKVATQIVQQDFSDRITKDISLQQQRSEEIWKPVCENKSHVRLEKAYHQLTPERLPFFDVLDQKKFTNQTKINFEELTKRYKINVVERWNDTEIDKMFGKGLNPTSLITSLESAEWFEKNLTQKTNPTVIELGTGAGWGTVMLFRTLQELNPEQKIKQFSVDMSAHSIAATETLLGYSKIPYITVEDGEELIQIQKWLKENPEGINFSGVILVLDKFNDAMDKFQEDSIDGVYSSHGTAYLSRNEYTNLLQRSTQTLKEGGIFIADSLNPLYTNKLDQIFTLRQIIDPDGMKKLLDSRNIEYMYGKEKIKNNSKYFLDQDVQVLTGFNTKHADLILKWCNYLLKNMEIERLMKTVKSLTVTMKVVDDYRADVFPSFLLDGVIQEQGLNFSKLEGRPNFPIFMDTQGFRLSKKK